MHGLKAGGYFHLLTMWTGSYFLVNSVFPSLFLPSQLVVHVESETM